MWKMAWKKDVLLGIILDELDTLPGKMRKAIEANYTVWPFDVQTYNRAPQPEENYEKEIDKIRKLTYGRYELLNKLFTSEVTSLSSPTKVNTKNRYYSIDGRALAYPVRGLNIVKQQDGTIHKVMILKWIIKTIRSMEQNVIMLV